MIHYLTVGMLDPRKVAFTELRASAPLPPGAVDLAREHADDPNDAQLRFEGHPVTITDDFVRCVWFSPRPNRTMARFAERAVELYGCIAADVEHARVIPPAELRST